MLEDGTISHEQARRLRSSIDIKTNPPARSPARSPAAKWPWLLAGLVFILACGGLLILQINGVIDAREAVNNQQADLGSQQQRRHDLTPQLITLVKRYLEHEKSTLESLTSQRAAALAPLQTALQNLESGTLQSTQAVHPVTQLLAVAESYPTLRSADQFQTLQAQIEGTENRINIARLKLNQSVREFNAMIQKIPGRWVAQWMDYPALPYVQTDEAAGQPPVQAW